MCDIYMTMYEAFFIGGCICITIILFFIYLCKKLSINYKTFLLHSVLGFLGFLGISTLSGDIIHIYSLGTKSSISLALCFSVIGFLIRQEIISFILLNIGLVLWYRALKMPDWFSELPTITNICFLDSAIFKTTFAFFIMMSTFLFWSIVHKKYNK